MCYQYCLHDPWVSVVDGAIVMSYFLIAPLMVSCN